MRLYRWVNYSGNKDSSSKWVEYTNDRKEIRDLFTLEPGTMVWLKTRENQPLHLDSAATLTPGDTFSITLPAGEWTDFGMPFRFSVPLSEIVAATGDDVENIDFCKWRQDEKSKRYRLDALYMHGVAGQSENEVLEYRTGTGYSFYNHHSSAVTLRIPSTLPDMVKNTGKAKRKNSLRSWGVSFSGTTAAGTVLSAVYCGYAQGVAKRRYPLSPSFATLRAMIIDRDKGAFYGNSIGEENEGGLVKELLIKNSADEASTVSWALHRSGELPAHYYEALFDPATGEVQTEGTISVGAKSTVSRFMIVGDAAFHERFMATVHSLQYTLHAPYPNPARSLVTIRYTVPAGAQEQVRLSIYSVAGRKVWEERTTGLLRSGVNRFVWDGHDRSNTATASGVYIVKLDVLNPTGALIRHFEQRLTYLR